MKKDTYEFTPRGVKIGTQSGMEIGSKNSHYIKWLMGWIDGGGWSGATTVRDLWEYAQTAGKPSGCSWYAYGLLMARERRAMRNSQD